MRLQRRHIRSGAVANSRGSDAVECDLRCIFITSDSLGRLLQPDRINIVRRRVDVTLEQPVRIEYGAPQKSQATTGETGGYSVQVASQRSEVDTKAFYRSLQDQFPAVLGSRNPMIKRVDLGEKGVYYRALIGPCGTSGEAAEFGGNLKSAGGRCVLERKKRHQ
jgi:hypothetical protein